MLRCPICQTPIQREDRCFRCENGHSFDIARQGYVNLLPVQQKHSAQPGDTKEQVAARRTFLEGDFYLPIVQALCGLALKYHCSGPILDAGCGEGYYSSRLADSMSAQLVGLDISKEAVRAASGRYKGHLWLCASAAHLPVEDHSIGLLTSLFAMTAPEEFRRALRPDGIFIQVLAAQDHLMGLKGIIYPQLNLKEKDSTPALSGFQLVESLPVKFTFTAEGQQLQNLLYMTPHVYRISKEGAEKLRATQQLTDTASCVINVYKPL